MKFKIVESRENVRLLLERDLESLNPDNVLQTVGIEKWEDFEYVLTSTYELDYKKTMVSLDHTASEEWKGHVSAEYETLLNKQLDILLDFWQKVFGFWNVAHLAEFYRSMMGGDDLSGDGDEDAFMVSRINKIIMDINTALIESSGVIQTFINKPNLLKQLDQEIQTVSTFVNRLESTMNGLTEGGIEHVESDDFLEMGYEALEGSLGGLGGMSEYVVSAFWYDKIIAHLAGLYNALEQLQTAYNENFDIIWRDLEEIVDAGIEGDQIIQAIENDELDVSESVGTYIVQLYNELGVQVSELEEEIRNHDWLMIDEQFDSSIFDENPPMWRLASLINDFEEYEAYGWTSRLGNVGSSKEEMGQKIKQYSDYMLEIDKLIRSGNVKEKLARANFYKQTTHFTGSMLEYVDALLEKGELGGVTRTSSGIHTNSWALFTQLSGHTYEELRDSFLYENIDDSDLIEAYRNIYTKQVNMISSWNKDLKRDGIQIPREFRNMEIKRIKKGGTGISMFDDSLEISDLIN